MSRLIFGCGFLGRRVARLWQDAGEVVHVVTRSESHAEEFEREGLRAIVADVTNPNSLKNLPCVDTVLFAVGYDRKAGHSIEEVYVDGVTNVVAALTESKANSDSQAARLSPTGRFLYASSTGVYGSTTDDWVDENSTCQPTRPGGVACLAAEKLLAASKLSEQRVILRFAGLYGPGRAAFIEQVRAGEPLRVSPQAALNLIHVDDAANVVLAAAEQAKPPITYCVSDGQPVTRAEYYKEIAQLIAAPPPRFDPPDPEQGTATRGSTDKRIRNKKLLAELEFQLAYPDYRTGLEQSLKEKP